jgi:deoxycytidine triphosphate deaminase
MIINPKEILQKKIITYPSNINIEEHIQQNGIDIDCIKVFTTGSASNVLFIRKDKTIKPTVYEKVSSMLNGIEVFKLETGKAYTFESSFEINIPEGMCAEIVGRSSLNRFGVFVRSSWYDTGFKGTIGATFYCFNDVIIEKGARVAQIVFRTAEAASMYKGQWQAK